MYRPIIKILFIALFILAMPHIAQAGFLDDVAYCTGTGDCNLQDIAIAFNSLIRLLLGGFGAGALIYFVWGGIQWLVSGGNMEKVARGKNIMLNTVFAIILAFGSYLIITFFVNDVLNVREDFRIEEGEFSSCFDAVRGEPCGNNRQCVGDLDPSHTHTDLSGKCLYACQVQSIENSVLAECVDSLPDGWQQVLGVGLCPGNQICGLAPN